MAQRLVAAARGAVEMPRRPGTRQNGRVWRQSPRNSSAVPPRQLLSAAGSAHITAVIFPAAVPNHPEVAWLGVVNSSCVLFLPLVHHPR
ncbi:uncharacterized protein LOC132217659 isoform X2 [Myotis daubentonii]|uniref:uncharacterized protein LOC132217659 isoform X2 n=1 Tax=Myotis daubentonii TaxID=98922 RepID=UPI002873E17D|nr:uncharacterized protein LOC132217659 isoform X2 [Myotis daubentonii]